MNIENLQDLLHQERMEEICDELEWSPRGHKCEAMDDVAERLQVTLDEESEANETLTELAEREINLQATA